MPLKEELIPYIQDIVKGAKHFNKSTRTIRRWLAHYDLYCPERKYRPGKTTLEMVVKIRKLDREGLTQSKIAQIIGLSQAMVGRIINTNANLKLSGTCTVNFQFRL